MPTETTNYQCPACTGPVHFDGQSGKLICDYCGSSYTVAEMDALYGQKTEQTAKEQEAVKEENSDGLCAYSCPSCGAQLVCEETTAATSCPYCGNPAVVPGKLSGSFRPDYVIPFRMDKEAAMSALRRHYKGKRFLPKEFSRENHVRELQGIYVPFWLFDGEATGEMTFQATRSHVHRHGNTEITTTDHFSVRRGGTMAFHLVPADGSMKMPDGHMDAIEPFDYGQMVPFSISYLPGFLADRYDVDAKAASLRVKERMDGSMVQALSLSAAGYDTCIPTSQNIGVDMGKAKYALFPVWMLHTRWREKDYLFAMNGQTGKLVGDLPVSWGRFWAWFGGIFAATAAAMSLVMLLF